MQVSIENSGTLERRMNVEIPEEQIYALVRQKLAELVRTVRLNGFRPGRAPLQVVERQYGARVRGDVLGDMLRTSFGEALQQHQLRPVADPVFDPVSAADGTGLTYTATFEVYPEVQLKPIEELVFTQASCEIVETDIDAMLEVLRKQHASWQEALRPAQNGDQVVLDFAGSVEGVELERGSATDHVMELGSANMIDGFEAGLIGAVAGEARSLDLHFPDPYQREDLAGKAVHFAVTVKKVSEKLVPELDDALFKQFGVEEGGLEAFRREVSENMQRERGRALQRRFNRHVMDQLSNANEVALPQALVAAEARRMHDESRRNLAMRGADPDRMGHPGPEFFTDQAQGRVKIGLIMAEIIRTSGASAPPAKVRQTVEAMASGYEDPEAMLRWYYADPKRLQEIEAVCLEEEAVNWLAARAQIAPEAISFDDLMNPGQTQTREQSQISSG